MKIEETYQHWRKGIDEEDTPQKGMDALYILYKPKVKWFKPPLYIKFFKWEISMLWAYNIDKAYKLENCVPVSASTIDEKKELGTVYPTGYPGAKGEMGVTDESHEYKEVNLRFKSFVSDFDIPPLPPFLQVEHPDVENALGLNMIQGLPYDPMFKVKIDQVKDKEYIGSCILTEDFKTIEDAIDASHNHSISNTSIYDIRKYNENNKMNIVSFNDLDTGIVVHRNSAGICEEIKSYYITQSDVVFGEMISFMLTHPEDPFYNLVHLLNDDEINRLLRWAGEDDELYCENMKIKTNDEDDTEDENRNNRK